MPSPIEAVSERPIPQDMFRVRVSESSKTSRRREKGLMTRKLSKWNAGEVNSGTRNFKGNEMIC
jgi:hypothetical protein